MKLQRFSIKSRCGNKSQHHNLPHCCDFITIIAILLEIVAILLEIVVILELRPYSPSTHCTHDI